MLMNWFKKWKLVDTTKYSIEPHGKPGKFQLTNQQIEQANKIYKEKGTIEYIFYPCGGLGYGVKVKVWKTNEYIDITDVSNW